MPVLKPLTVIGLNSGTSMDGIDAAAFRIIPSRQVGGRTNGAAITQRLEVEMIEAAVHPFETQFQRRLQQIIGGGRISLEDICRLNVALGEVFADAALALMKQAGLTRDDVDLIGSHGQTLWHAPAERKFAGITSRGTLQLGEPAVIAARTGVTVVGDFRPADMAVGGQGAPLVSFADEVLFGGGEPTGVLNIGGIANITIIDDHGEASIAFDTGPGNMIIDRAMERFFQRPFDESGATAARGKHHMQWLDRLLEDKYFKQAPPKTTGRELFGISYADRLIDEGLSQKLSPEDIISTLTALTAFSIADSYKQFVQPKVKIEALILGGGGAYNTTLIDMMNKRWPHQITISKHEDYGVSTKFKEALLFALLAYTTNFGLPNNVPKCTGASSRVCLGKICRP